MKINAGDEFPFDNGYGHFEDNGWSYRITNPQTPRPWVNILANEIFGAVVSQAGGGYSWRENAQLNRITRWEQDLIKDEWGKFLYVRDADSQHYWSAAWKPVCAEPEQYTCTHGIGFTRFESRHFGIQSDWTIFIPPKDPLEVWLVTLTNLSSVRRRLQLFTYFEWNLGAAPDWHREFHRSYINTSFDPDLNAILATKRLWEVPSAKGHWNRNWEYVAFHGCSDQPASYDGDKESFLGMYRGLSSPKSVLEGRLGKNIGDGLDAIASLQHDVFLEPGESKTLVYSIGAAKNNSEARKLIRTYQNEKAARGALEEVKRGWRSLLTRFESKTPDDAMNLLLSPWLQYQAISGRILGRTGYYQTGGAYGFRDQLQDSQIFLPLDPHRTSEQIRLHARHQFKNGTVYHWWHPLSEIGLTTQMTDDLLWLPYLAKLFLDETGDYKFLKTKEPFVDQAAKSSIYEHCVRAIDCVLGRMSKRGLPHIGAGDWNDGLSAVGLGWKGESIWLGQFLHRILLDFTEIAEVVRDHRRALRYRKQAARLRASINKYGWDGKYFYGATKDSGEKIGSSKNKEGKVWLNTQTWAILGDVADPVRANQVFSVIESDLEMKNGPLLLQPAYSAPDEDIGYLTRYAPGMRENGGVYTHAATWSILAASKLGKAESAYRLFRKLNPVLLGMKPEEYVAEPYVTPGNIEGPASRFYGKGGWTWYSGSAAWLFRAAVEGILGIYGTSKGLLIQPCIPSKWTSYSVKRLYRGAVYDITVDNPHNASTGISSVKVDGKSCEISPGAVGVVLETFKKNTNHDVIVTLGNGGMKS